MLTNDDMDDLVDEWHLDYEGPLELVDFLASRTGLSNDQVVHWIETAELPIKDNE
jgi:hypothetical protein